MKMNSIDTGFGIKYSNDLKPVDLGFGIIYLKGSKYMSD